MTPLDFPSTYTADESSAGSEPSDAGVRPSSLSALRLERYLAEENCHERLSLGVPPLGVNKATVRRYLPEIIQAADSDASLVEATRGTMTDCDKRGCRGSTTTATSTASDGSPDPVRANDSNDALADAAASALLSLASSSNQPITPSLAGLGQTDMALFKPEQASAGSEFHRMGSDTCGQDLEAGLILMYVMHRLLDNPLVTNRHDIDVI